MGTGTCFYITHQPLLVLQVSTYVLLPMIQPMQNSDSWT